MYMMASVQTTGQLGCYWTLFDH